MRARLGIDKSKSWADWAEEEEQAATLNKIPRFAGDDTDGDGAQPMDVADGGGGGALDGARDDALEAALAFLARNQPRHHGPKPTSANRASILKRAARHLDLQRSQSR